VTDLEFRLYCALKLIAKGYDTPSKLRRTCERKCGVSYEEALGFAYENIQAEAAAAIKGVRVPKDRLNGENS